MIFIILLFLAMFALWRWYSRWSGTAYEEYLKLEEPDLYKEIHEQKLREMEWKIEREELRRRL